MTWFQRKKAGILTDRRDQNDTPAGQWVKCPECSEILNRREFQDNLRVCPKCNHHFSMDSMGYFGLLFDNGTFVLHDSDLISTDPLAFHDRKPYDKRLDAARAKTQMNEAARAATGTIGGHEISIASMDFGFIGGSMGSVVGEIIARAIRRGVDRRTPVMVISQSGGARMMEGALSLMQMAKTSVHLARLSELGLPYISLLTNPTTGGVTASFAMLGDFNIAEPGALIGFAGPRVIRETIGQDLPEDFQSAEFLQKKGFIDMTVDRRELRERVRHLLDLVMEDAAPPSTS
jgi:acetyl-CoA carboxylase carboxyl transferase subunit beta